VLLALMPGSYSMTKDLPTIPHTHVDMVSGAAAAAVSFIGELLMIKVNWQRDEHTGYGAARGLGEVGLYIVLGQQQQQSAS
jgi:hypothetical protein